MDPQTAWEAVQEWSPSERLTFAARLWEDTLADGQPEPPDDFIAELDRRLDAHEADPANVLTAAQVREQFRNRL